MTLRALRESATPHPPQPRIRDSRVRATPGAAAARQDISGRSVTEEAEQAKQRLLSEIPYTNRGGTASTNQQGAVEDAQLGVEAFGTRLDYAKLAGTWRLLYTTAPDVLGLVAKPPEGLPVPLRVGDIYQRFSTPGACGWMGHASSCMNDRMTWSPYALCRGGHRGEHHQAERAFSPRRERGSHRDRAGRLQSHVPTSHRAHLPASLVVVGPWSGTALSGG